MNSAHIQSKAAKLIGWRFTVQMDNETKHNVKADFQKSEKSIFQCPSQSRDLSPTEQLFSYWRQNMSGEKLLLIPWTPDRIKKYNSFTIMLDCPNTCVFSNNYGPNCACISHFVLAAMEVKSKKKRRTTRTFITPDCNF